MRKDISESRQDNVWRKVRFEKQCKIVRQQLAYIEETTDTQSRHAPIFGLWRRYVPSFLARNYCLGSTSRRKANP